jgi:hypothetical protein
VVLRSVVSIQLAQVVIAHKARNAYDS